MTVDFDPKSKRKVRRVAVKKTEQQSATGSENSHQLAEHSFGKHSFDQSDIEQAVRGYSSSRITEDEQRFYEDARQDSQEYMQGYEDTIKSIADAISEELSELQDEDEVPVREQYTPPSYETEDLSGVTYPQSALPETVHHELQSLLSAAEQVGDVIRHFHEVANRTNLFALKVTADAMKSESGGTDLAGRVRELADETYISAEKIYACMYSIQQTIVSIADNRFEEFKHISVDKETFQRTSIQSRGRGDEALKAISPKTLSSLVDELNKLRGASSAGEHYNELGNFADQLNNEIENLKKQLKTGS